MTIKHPLTSEKRKKVVGERIKKIRTDNRYTQSEFGRLVSPDAPSDKRVVYRWEQGNALPSGDRLKNIAELGGMTEENLKYGTIADYIEGIFLYEDSLLIKDDYISSVMSLYLPKSTKDITLRSFVEIIPTLTLVRIDINSFDSLNKEKQTQALNITIEMANEGNISHFEIEKILSCFQKSMAIISEGKIDMIINPILNTIDTIEEFVNDELHESQSYGDKEYPLEAVTELLDSIANFKHQLIKINKKYDN